MDRRIATLLNSPKCGNIFDHESQAINELIHEYFTSSNSNEEEKFQMYSDSDDESNNEPVGFSQPQSTMCQSQPVGLEDCKEIEKPIVRIEENVDPSDMNCNGQPLNELQMAEQFSCHCKQIKCIPAADDR